MDTPLHTGPAAGRLCLRLAGIALAAVLLQGCLSAGRLVPDALKEGAAPDPVFVDGARRALPALYPAHARMTHRAVLTVGSRQFALDGYVAKSGDSLRLVARGAVGLVAEVKWTRADGPEVIRTGAFFRSRWSRDFMARDLALLFASPAGELAAGALADGSIVLRQNGPVAGGQLNYIFSQNGDMLRGIRVRQPGRPDLEVECVRYRSFEGYPRPVPSEFVVRSDNYMLHLSVVDLAVVTDTKDDR